MAVYTKQTKILVGADLRREQGDARRRDRVPEEGDGVSAEHAFGAIDYHPVVGESFEEELEVLEMLGRRL